VNLFESTVREFRFGFRSLQRDPVLLSVVMLTLGLAIGANSTVFSLINGIFLSEVTANQPSRLVRIELGESNQISYSNFTDLQGLRSFTDLEGYSQTELNIDLGAAQQRVSAEVVTPGFFHMLGTKPFRGRLFSRANARPESSPRIAVVSYEFARRLNAEPAEALGKDLRVNGQIFTIIGLLPPRFRSLAGYGAAPDVYLPLSNALGQLDARDQVSLELVGRLAPGIARAQAAADLTIAARRLEQQYPDQNRNFGRVRLIASVTGLDRVRQLGADPVLVFLTVLLVIVAIVLLIACANISSLLLARAASRRAEHAAMIALGAPRWAVVRRGLIESFILVVLGSGLGLFLTWLFSGVLEKISGSLPFPLHVSFGLDKRVGLFCLLLIAITTVLTSLAPVTQTLRVDLVSALRGEQLHYLQRRFNLRVLLITGQITMSVLLLVTMSLFVRSLLVINNIDPGFDTAHTASVQVLLGKATQTPAALRAFYMSVADRVRALPGVRSASCGAIIPLSFSSSGIGDLRVVGSPSPQFGSAANTVCPAWFSTMAIPLVRGREFTASDRAGSAPVAIVNETFARTYLHERDPLGAFLACGNGADREIYQIVGLVRDSKYSTMGELPTPMLYLPYLQSNRIRLHASLVFRSAVPPSRLFSSVKQVVAEAVPSATIEARSMSETVAFATLPNRVAAFLLLILASVAVVLTIVGLYGMATYETSQRTSEIGIRMALGASRGVILKMLLQRGIWIVATGEAIGIALAWLATKPLSMFLASSIRTTDSLSYIGIAVLLAVTALSALIGPAWRAAGLDPSNALRYQ